MARPTVQPRGIDRIAALIEPTFPGRMLGFGLIYAWSTCLWDIPLLAPFGSAALQTDASWTLSAAITPLACIAGSLVGRTRELDDFRSLYLIGPILTAAGSLFAIAHPFLSGPSQIAALLLAGIGTGVGPVILILLWTCLFARTETGVVETVVPASFVATLVCALVIPNLPDGLAVAMVTLLPLASGALLLLSKRAIDTGAVPHENIGERRVPGTVRRLNIARIFLVIFSVYGIGCLMSAASTVEVSAQADAGATIVGMLFALALAAGIVLFSRHINFDALFRWISAPFVFSIIFIALGTPWAATASRALVNAVFTGIEIIMVLYFVRLAQKTGRTSTLFVGIGECAAYAGVFAGYAAQPATQELIEGGTFDPAVLCLMLIGAFTLATLLVPRRDVVWTESTGIPEDPMPDASIEPDGADHVIAARRQAVAQRYGLSRRETEIFLLLAQGRSRPYIRDELVLSKNTVATHIRHIYEKMGIHSQQELIDLAQHAE